MSQVVTDGLIGNRLELEVYRVSDNWTQSAHRNTSMFYMISVDLAGIVGVALLKSLRFGRFLFPKVIFQN